MTSTYKLRGRQALCLLLAGGGLSLAMGLGGQFKLAPFDRLEMAFQDAAMVLTASGAPAPGTVVVDIDEPSLSALGQWPWPRYRIASLIQRIAAEKPAAIAVDVLFPEPDRVSLDNIQQTFKRDFNIELSFSGLPKGMLDNDGYLGDVIAHTGVVGSRYFYFDHTTRSEKPLRTGVGFEGRTDLLSLDEAPGVLDNAASITSQTALTGFLNSRVETDGVLRRLPLLIKHRGIIHANLSLVATMSALGVRSGVIESDANGLAIRIGTHRVPIDDAGYATLRFNGASPSYDAISAVDLLSGRTPGSALRGKIVFIGTSAAGLNDIHMTAIDRHFPGLKIQGVMAQNILDDHFARTPQWAGKAALATCLFVGVMLSALVVMGARIATLVAVNALASAVVLGASATLFVYSGLIVSPGAPLLLLATLLALTFVIRFMLGRQKAHQWRRQLENARQVTIESMASVAETRDPETGAHIKRTQHYVRAIAERLKFSGHYTETLTKEFIHLLYISAPLHDIGKVGIPDHILLKPGRLTPEEMEIMKQHADFGRKIIFSTAERIDGDNFLIIAGQIAATHHEKWDGTGYPLGLTGQEIPLSGRIMAAADIYDALISRRCYKEPFTHEHSISLMREMRGTTFDPVVLDAFFEIEETILQIAGRFRDEAEGVDELRLNGAAHNRN